MKLIEQFYRVLNFFFRGFLWVLFLMRNIFLFSLNSYFTSLFFENLFFYVVNREKKALHA